MDPTIRTVLIVLVFISILFGLTMTWHLL